LIGSPGSLNRRGSAHKNIIVKTLDDTSHWYDNPAVDDLPEVNATLDDYLGLSL